MLQPGPHSAKQAKKPKKKLGPHRLGEGAHGCHVEGSGEGIVREFGMDVCTLLYSKWITNKGPLYSQGTPFNVMWQPGWKGSLGQNGYMCMYD